MREGWLTASGSVRLCLELTRWQVGSAREGYVKRSHDHVGKIAGGQQAHDTASGVSSSLLSATLAELREFATASTGYSSQLLLRCH